jgi:hypothetical protein
MIRCALLWMLRILLPFAVVLSWSVPVKGTRATSSPAESVGPRGSPGRMQRSAPGSLEEPSGPERISP